MTNNNYYYLNSFTRDECSTNSQFILFHYLNKHNEKLTNYYFVYKLKYIGNG